MLICLQRESKACRVLDVLSMVDKRQKRSGEGECDSRKTRLVDGGWLTAKNRRVAMSQVEM